MTSARPGLRERLVGNRKVPQIDDATHLARTGETPFQRSNRQLAELLQELRVVQMGVQILLAFLLAIPFQARFPDLATASKTLYAISVISISLALVLLMTPVALHRAWFERGVKAAVIRVSTRLARVGMLLLAIGLLASISMVLGMVLPWPVAIVVTATVGLSILWFWLLLPVLGSPRLPHRHETSAPGEPE